MGKENDIEQDMDVISDPGAENAGMQKSFEIFSRCLNYICRPFGTDPQGAVYRTWGACLLLMTILFISAIFEARLIHSTYNEAAPISIAAIWTAVVQLLTGLVGTFVLRRFPTEFSVGFFLGLMVVVAQQNFILFATFSDPTFNMLSEVKTSKLFAALLFITGFFYVVFVLMLTNFREHILLAPVDVKRVISRLGSVERGSDITPVSGNTNSKASFEHYVDND